jgi:hypothetical protein
MQKEPMQLRRCERLCQKAQKTLFTEEMPQSLLREVLKHDFCLTAFEINEDEFRAHSENHLVQTSGEINIISQDTAQNSSIKADGKKQPEIIGEEPNLNEPQNYNEAMQAPDVNEWMDAMKF